MIQPKVTVSTQHCEEALKLINDDLEKDKEVEEFVIVNLGVAASRKQICLETRAKNICDFGIPDELGF